MVHKSDASLLSQQSTGVLLLHRVYLTIWYISKKGVFLTGLYSFFIFLPYIYSILLNNLIYNRRKSKSPPQVKFLRGMRVDNIEFSSGWISNGPFIHRKHGRVSNSEDEASSETNTRWSFHLSLGGWSLSPHSLHFTTFVWQKVWQNLFNVKATLSYTGKTDFFPNSRSLRCVLHFAFVKPVAPKLF